MSSKSHGYTVRCNDLVPGCDFSTSASSEDGVLKNVAEHARIAHGVKEVTPELAAKAKAAMRKHTKHVSCSDIVAGCQFSTSAATEEDVLHSVADHARVAHGVTEITPELAAKAKAAIKNR